MQMYFFVYAIVKTVENTHRHPANQALHCIGAPFYAIGLAMTIGHFAGMHIDLAVGVAMWLAAVIMFVFGHKIEGNVESITPVLLFRVLSKIACNSVTQRVQLLRARLRPVPKH
jgi:hypothetical protein